VQVLVNLPEVFFLSFYYAVADILMRTLLAQLDQAGSDLVRAIGSVTALLGTWVAIAAIGRYWSVYQIVMQSLLAALYGALLGAVLAGTFRGSFLLGRIELVAREQATSMAAVAVMNRALQEGRGRRRTGTGTGTGTETGTGRSSRSHNGGGNGPDSESESSHRSRSSSRRSFLATEGGAADDGALHDGGRGIAAIPTPGGSGVDGRHSSSSSSPGGAREGPESGSRSRSRSGSHLNPNRPESGGRGRARDRDGGRGNERETGRWRGEQDSPRAGLELQSRRHAEYGTSYGAAAPRPSWQDDAP